MLCERVGYKPTHIGLQTSSGRKHGVRTNQLLQKCLHWSSSTTGMWTLQGGTSLQASWDIWRARDLREGGRQEINILKNNNTFF